MTPRPPRSTRTPTLSLRDALPISAPFTLDSKPDSLRLDVFTQYFLHPWSFVVAVTHGPFLDTGANFLAAIPSFRNRQTPAGYLHSFRSEEHTSELQSLMRISYAVFCLKKKKHNNNHTSPTT